MIKRKKTLIFILEICFLLILWELIPTIFPNMRFVFPKFSTVACTTIKMWPTLQIHVFTTLYETLISLILAICIAFPLGWIISGHKYYKTLLEPLLIFIQCIPMFTLAPIMIMIFGWSILAIIIPTILMIIFPLTINIYQGLNSVPKHLINFFLVNGASKFKILFKLLLPYSMPHIFAGLKIAASIAGIGAISGEWAGAQKGLGILMLDSRRNLDLDITFSALICLIIISSLTYFSIIMLEKTIFKKFFHKK